MAISPVEIRHVRLKRGLFGYRREAVDRLLEEIADSFENIWRERGDFAERVEELEQQVARNAELEELLRSTLVSAERTAQELREQARREADLIVQEAHAESRSVTRAASAERERLRGETRRAKALVASALAMLDDAEADATPSQEPGRSILPDVEADGEADAWPEPGASEPAAPADSADPVDPAEAAEKAAPGEDTGTIEPQAA